MTEAADARYKALQREALAQVGALLGEVAAQWLDDNGYPTEAALKRIEEWPNVGAPESWAELLAFVHSLWEYADCGYWTECLSKDTVGRPVREYAISTAGWSGNESIIHAMDKNVIFWAFCWVQSRRGGHYIFQVRLPQ